MMVLPCLSNRNFPYKYILQNDVKFINEHHITNKCHSGTHDSHEIKQQRKPLSSFCQLIRNYFDPKV